MNICLSRDMDHLYWLWALQLHVI